MIFDSTISSENRAWAEAELTSSVLALSNLADQLHDISDMAAVIVRTLRSGGRVFFCGNGGSAADSQHLAAELVGKQNFDRPALSGIALTVDSSALTAIANDYEYAEVFSRQLRALGHPGDVIVGLSTSGRSKNVVRAFESAGELDIVRIAFTGSKTGAMSEIAEHVLLAPSTTTARIQQCHITAGHIMLALVERTMFTPPSPSP